MIQEVAALRYIQGSAIKLAGLTVPAHSVPLQVTHMGIARPALRPLELHVTGLDDDAPHPYPLPGRAIEFPSRVAR